MGGFSLFADGDFVLEADLPLVAAAETTGLFDEFVADEPVVVEEPVAVDEPAPCEVVEQGPRYRELEVIEALIAQPNTVLIQKIGHRGVSVTAMDVQSALMLMTFKIGGASAVRPDLPTQAQEPAAWDALPTLGTAGVELKMVPSQDEGKKNRFDQVKVYFKIQDCIAPTFQESKVYRFLASIGVHVVAAPSFDNWVPRQYRKQIKESTPLHLPEVIDTRPLYERIEEGTKLNCIRTSAQFHADKVYVVGQKTAANEDTGEEGFALLHQFERGKAYSHAVRWNESDAMEDSFTPSEVQQVIYDPELCIPTVYKREFEANQAVVQAKVDSKEWQLFDHTIYDVSQAAVLPNYFNGKPMRMGKSRETLVWHKLRGNKRVGIFCPKNVAGFMAREADILGMKDYKIINSYKDLQGETQPWAEIIPYGWMKYKRDPLAVKNAKALTEIKPCPHCGQNLERRMFSMPPATDENPNPVGVWSWTTSYGYLCRNEDCQYLQQLLDPKTTKPGRKPKRRGGAAWFEEAAEDQVMHAHSVARRSGTPLRGSGYVDLDRKVHVLHMFTPTGTEAENARFHGRECKHCRHVEQSWTPAPYRRLKHRYDGITLDEIHGCKTGSSDITKAVVSLHARNFNGLTGTLMPNDPSDAFWPLFRMFGNDTHAFPYAKTQSKPYQGVTAFNADYTDSLTVQNFDRDTSYKKRIPYLKSPIKFWQMMAPKMIRRTYQDPLVQASLLKAGLKEPRYETKMIVVPPDPKQAALMLASMQEFDTQFQEYRASLAARGTEDRTYLLNSAYVISRMTRLRMGATCPDYINGKLADINMPPMYLGAKGGAKMEQVYNLCLNKCSQGEKVLLLSDFQCMQQLMAEELSVFRPILFDTSWNGGKRQEAFDLFNEDPDYKIFIAGPRGIAEGVDLAGGPDSKCRTVISTDLLWNPGRQLQAWSRIMKPAKEDYLVDVFVLILDASIDKHVYNTFYSKLFAAEQALDRKVVSKVKTFDVGAFVEQVLADRDRMLEYLQASSEDDMSYMPYVDMFTAMGEREI